MAKHTLLDFGDGLDISLPSTHSASNVAVCLSLAVLDHVANVCLQDEQQIKHYREDTARMREQISDLQTRWVVVLSMIIA